MKECGGKDDFDIQEVLNKEICFCSTYNSK